MLKPQLEQQKAPGETLASGNIEDARAQLSELKSLLGHDKSKSTEKGFRAIEGGTGTTAMDNSCAQLGETDMTGTLTGRGNGDALRILFSDPLTQMGTEQYQPFLSDSSSNTPSPPGDAAVMPDHQLSLMNAFGASSPDGTWSTFNNASATVENTNPLTFRRSPSPGLKMWEVLPEDPLFDIHPSLFDDQWRDLLTPSPGSYTQTPTPSLIPTTAKTVDDHLWHSSVVVFNHIGFIICQDGMCHKSGPLEATKLAMLGMGAGISAHPELMAKYGGRHAAMYDMLKQTEDMLHESQVESDRTCGAYMVAAALSYGLGMGPKAHKYIGDGLRILRHQSAAEPGPQQYLVIESLMFGRKKPNYASSEAQLEGRRLLWSSAIMMDTWASMASSKPLRIDECQYGELLYDQRPWEDAAAAEKRRRAQVECVQSIPLPTNTIFHECGMSESAELAFRSMASESSLDLTRCLQLHFCVRRVLRFLKTLEIGGLSNLNPPDLQGGAMAVLSVMPGANNANDLHEALLEWHANLPPEWRIFESLAMFRDRPTHPPAWDAADRAKWVHNPMAVQNIFTYIYGLCVLHSRPLLLPNALGHTYRIDTKSATRVSSLDIIKLARRAMTYMVSTIWTTASPPSLTTIPFSPTSLDTPIQTILDTPVTPSTPPAPPAFSCSPTASLNLACVSILSLHASRAYMERDGSVTDEAMEGVEDVTKYMLPTLENLARIWVSGQGAAKRVRQVVAEVLEVAKGVVGRGKGSAEGGACGGGIMFADSGVKCWTELRDVGV
ncbi:hypothetical protein HK104_009850 [Borealophlyctis nickersoniae]|nr:hypothetical protein HK104_009850 [Borealophlyctis nickersoniae]